MRTFHHRSVTTWVVSALLFSLGTAVQAQDASKPAVQSPPATNAPQSQKDSTQEAVAPDIKPEALWDGRKIMPFRTLDFPKMVNATDADFLDDTDYVMGVTAHGESRAYPTRFLWWHHAINDNIGKAASGGAIPVAVTYCSVCNTGICYDPTVSGKTVLFDFYGLYNGVVTLCERETQSVFLQAEGRFVTGALSGTQIKLLPMLDTTWGEWKQLHPDTLVMSPDTPYSKFYNPRGKPEPRGYDRFPAPFFLPTVTRGDLRLPPFEKVLGVTVAAPANRTRKDAQEPAAVRVWRRAYSLNVLQQKGCVVTLRTV